MSDDEFAFDAVEDPKETLTSAVTDIIGQSEINRLSLARPNGIITVPQTLIKLRTS